MKKVSIRSFIIFTIAFSSAVLFMNFLLNPLTVPFDISTTTAPSLSLKLTRGTSDPLKLLELSFCEDILLAEAPIIV